jgi:hypothetical protein
VTDMRTRLSRSRNARSRARDDLGGGPHAGGCARVPRVGVELRRRGR